MITKITCCLNCTNRHIGCHGECDTYKQQKNQREADLEIARAENALDYYFKRRGTSRNAGYLQKGNFIKAMSK